MATNENSSPTTAVPFSDTSRPIVIGIDGSESSLDALRYAAHIAQALGLKLVALALWNYPTSMYDVYSPPPEWSPKLDAQRALDETIQAVFGDELPDWLSAEVLRGLPIPTLIDKSESASMLVLGSRGLGGFAGMLLGSVSRAVSAHAKCPVLVVHADDAKVLG